MEEVGKFLSALIFVIALIFGGMYYFKGSVRSHMESKIDSIFDEQIRQDILFTANFIPTLCDGNSTTISGLAYFGNSSDTTDQALMRTNARIMHRILINFDKALRKAEAQNMTQEQLKKDMLEVFDRVDVSNIEAETDNPMDGLRNIGSFISEISENISVEKLKDYFISIGKKYDDKGVIDTKDEILFAWYEIIGIELMSDDEQTDKVLANFNEIAMNIPAYREAYEGGCIKLIENELRHIHR